MTITNGNRGVLVTPANTIGQCRSTTKSTVTGNAVGEIQKPTAACPVNTKDFRLGFTLTGGSQTHKTIDGSATEYDLSETEAGSVVTAGFENQGGNGFNEEVAIDCNTL